MNLESRIVTVSKSSKDLFESLEQLANYEGLMPENLEKFEVDGDSFMFGLKGMPEIRLVLEDKIPYSKIVLGAASSKLPFTLSLTIDEVSEQSCEVQLFFEGTFNPMVSIMVKKPLTKLMETLSDGIEKL